MLSSDGSPHLYRHLGISTTLIIMSKSPIFLHLYSISYVHFIRSNRVVHQGGVQYMKLGNRAIGLARTRAAVDVQRGEYKMVRSYEVNNTEQFSHRIYTS